MTDKPKIELRNIKHAEFASHETNCYEASLYVDGERWGTVSNEGHGGCDNFHGVGGKTYADLKALNERIAATFDSYCPEGHDGPAMLYDLEMVCGDLLEDWLREREYRKVLKKPTYINDKGQVMQFTLKRGQKLPALLDALREKRPELKLLNDMPFADAKAAMQAAGL